MQNTDGVHLKNLNNIGSAALLFFTLNERVVTCNCKKKLGLNKSDLQILAYGTRYKFFSVFDVSVYFRQMNVQQLRRTMAKLKEMELLEIVRPPYKHKPTLYVVSFKGEDRLNSYLELWEAI